MALAEAVPSQSRPPQAVGWLYYAVAVLFTAVLLYYYWTGEGGPALLAFALVPVSFVLFTLEALRKSELYPSLPPAARYAIAVLYVAASVAVASYMRSEEHTSELQSRLHLVCRLLLEKNKSGINCLIG